MKQIIIDITDEGEVKIETKGFTGKACMEETKLLKNLLGQETYQQLTPAYYIQEKTHCKKYLNLCG